MMPVLDELEDMAAKYPDAQVHIILQRMGGKKKAETGPEVKLKKGGAPGFIDFQDVTPSHPAEVAAAEAFFDGRIKKHQKGKKG